jgi:hypothetical protein
VTSGFFPRTRFLNKQTQPCHPVYDYVENVNTLAKRTNAYGWKNIPTGRPSSIPNPHSQKAFAFGVGVVLAVAFAFCFMTSSSQVAQSLAVVPPTI